MPVATHCPVRAWAGEPVMEQCSYVILLCIAYCGYWTITLAPHTVSSHCGVPTDATDVVPVFCILGSTPSKISSLQMPVMQDMVRTQVLSSCRDRWDSRVIREGRDAELTTAAHVWFPPPHALKSPSWPRDTLVANAVVQRLARLSESLPPTWPLVVLRRAVDLLAKSSPIE